MDIPKSRFLSSIHSLLQYHQALGVDGYPENEDTSSFLETGEAAVGPGPVASGGLQNQVNRAEISAGERTIETCEDIAGEVRSCTGCILHTKRLLAVPGRGGQGSRLFIVGGWLVGERGVSLPVNSIFGPEEDEMLSRMLAAINLSPEKAFITNVIKCAVTGDCHPGPENIHTCFSFLQRQIQLLDPEIICTMGIVATKALLKSPQSLSQLRGKRYPFVVSGGKTIPVIPTYHPTFLLKNPDFKRATWEDLQTINKHLTLVRR